MSKRPLHSHGYHQLAIAYAELERRRVWPGHPVLDCDTTEIVDAVRSNDDASLRALIERIQTGDDAAGVVALWALHERLRALVHASEFFDADRSVMFDDHLTIAWWVLREADPTLNSLADRALSRTWRRYHRLQARNRPRAAAELPDIATSGDPTPERAFARTDLREVLDAVEAGRITAKEWQALLAHRVDGEDQPGIRTGRARRQWVYRTTLKLRDFTAA